MRDALIAVEEKRAELTKTKEFFKEAVSIKDSVTSPKSLDLYNHGNYEEFVNQVQRTRELLLQWNDAVAAAKKVGVVPSAITALPSIPDPESLSQAFHQAGRVPEERQTGPGSLPWHDAIYCRKMV